MDRRRTVELLTRSMPELRGRFGMTRLALFGSTVRDTARSDSDADVLFAVDGQATSARYFGVEVYLEDLMGRPVDLVTERALRRELRTAIERERFDVRG